MTNFNQDECIVLKMATDFNEGFRLLFTAYYKPLIRIAQRMIGINFAEDIVQDTFMEIWHRKSNYESVISLKSYLYTTIQNKCLNVIRKENLQEKYKEESQSEQWEEYILDEEVFIQLYQAIESLPEHYKETMVRSLEGKPIASIAASMNTSEDTIKAYKRRAKQVLKQRLGNLSIYTEDADIRNINSLSIVVYFIASIS